MPAPPGHPDVDPDAVTRPRQGELLRHGDVQLEVLVDGNSGPSIVLLPSSLRDSFDFDELASLLVARGLRVLRPQPRGMGRSSAPPEDLSLHTLAADVARVVEQLGGGEAIVAGHAYGHHVARMVDLAHPQCVRGVALLAASAHEVPPGLVDCVDIACDPARPQAQRLASLRQAFFAPGNDPSAWLQGWHPQWRTVYRRAGALPPKDHWWPRAHRPLLDLQAALDPWRPRATAGELQAVLGAQVEVCVIDGASHALVPEQPVAVADALADWCHRLPGAGARPHPT